MRAATASRVWEGGQQGRKEVRNEKGGQLLREGVGGGSPGEVRGEKATGEGPPWPPGSPAVLLFHWHETIRRRMLSNQQQLELQHSVLQQP